MSLPMRERELKLGADLSEATAATSLPMRERELKRPESLNVVRNRPVAPHAGA